MAPTAEYPPSSYGSRQLAVRNSVTMKDFSPPSNEEDDPAEGTDTAASNRLLSGSFKSKLDESKQNRPNAPLRKNTDNAKRKSPSQTVESKRKKAATTKIDFLSQASTYPSTSNRQSPANSKSVSSSSFPSSLVSGSKSVNTTEKYVKSPPIPRKKSGKQDPIEQSCSSDTDSVKSVQQPVKKSKANKKEDRKPKSGSLFTGCNESDGDVQDVTHQTKERRESVDSSWEPSPTVAPVQAMMAEFDRYDEKVSARKAHASKKENNRVIDVDDDAQNPKLHLTKWQSSKRLDPKSASGGILATTTALPKSSYGKGRKRNTRKRKGPANKVQAPSASSAFSFSARDDKQTTKSTGSQRPAGLELESTKNGTEHYHKYAGAQRALAHSPIEDPSKKRMSARKAKKKATEEVIPIFDDDDDDKHEELAYFSMEAKRIAIGNLVAHGGCLLRLLEGVVHITFRPETNNSEVTVYQIKDDDLRLIKFYNRDGRALIFLQAQRTHANKLPPTKIYDPVTQYIVIEFHEDIKKLIEVMQGLFPSFCTSNEVDSDSELNKMCEAFSDSRKKTRSGRNRRKAKRTQRPVFLEGKNNEDILVDFPFGTTAIYNAARDLPVLSCVLDDENVGSDKEEETDCESGVHVVIRVADFDCLEPGVFLNDNMIDFFCQWIWHNADKTEVHFFTSHFFSTLESEGPSGVMSWTKRRGINIFKKKFIFIPVVNPNHAKDSEELIEKYSGMEELGSDDVEACLDSPVPCMLFFDSLKAHGRANVRKRVQEWLDSEWERINPEYKERKRSIFATDRFPIISPKIPQQTNGCDCGVFVCRYAYAMYKLRNQDFTYSSAGIEPGNKPPRNAFQQQISASIAFQFTMDDIAQIRSDLCTLIEKLHAKYIPWREEHRARAKEQRGKKRELKSADQNGAIIATVPGDRMSRLSSDSVGASSSQDVEVLSSQEPESSIVAMEPVDRKVEPEDDLENTSNYGRTETKSRQPIAIQTDQPRTQSGHSL